MRLCTCMLTKEVFTVFRFCFRKLELQSSFLLYMGMATNDFTNNNPILWPNLIIRTWPQILFEQLIVYSSYLSKFNCIHFARGMMQQAAAPTDVKFQVSTGRLPHGSKFLRIVNFRRFEVFSTTLIQKTKILRAKISFMIEGGTENDSIERFSFECRKVIGFALSTRCDWLKRFAPPFHPIRSKTKANCDALACIFPRFASATCNYFEF